jgi:Na+-translocating ferredoxin:NAD+ oxidoreductase RnfG subunit
LGDYITSPDFRDRFRGKAVAPPLAAVQADPSSPHEVLALTGATISSWSVCTIVNKAIEQLREPILSQNASNGS